MWPTKLYSPKSAMKRKNSTRQGPLHAVGFTILSTVDIAYRKTLESQAFSGSTWRRRMAKFAESADPLIYAVQCQFLAILSFFDDHIMLIEDMIEKSFPSSSFVFDKIDDLALAITSIPEKIDYALNKFDAIIHNNQLTFKESVLIYLIWGLNVLIFILNQRGMKNKKINELTIHTSSICRDKLEPSPNVSSPESSERSHKESYRESFPATSESDASEAENIRVAMAVWANKRISYKEALEKGKDQENSQSSSSSQKRKKKNQCPKGVRKEKEDENAKMEKKFWRQKGARKEKNEEDDDEEDNESIVYGKEEDPLLDLFESGWNLKHERDVGPINVLRN